MSDHLSRCQLQCRFSAIDGKAEPNAPPLLVEPAPNQPYLVAPGKPPVQKLPDIKMTSSQSSTLSARIERWPIAGSFTISRGGQTEAVTVVAEVSRGGHIRRGGCVPYPRYGEGPGANLAALL